MWTYRNFFFNQNAIKEHHSTKQIYVSLLIKRVISNRKNTEKTLKKNPGMAYRKDV